MHAAHDERGQLTAGWRSRFSHCLLFDPTDAKSARYNPLLEVRKGAAEVRDVQNIAEAEHELAQGQQLDIDIAAIEGEMSVLGRFLVTKFRRAGRRGAGDRAVGRGRSSDELHDRRYVILDGIDGRTHYADLGVRQATDDPLIRNTIVEVRAPDAGPRDIDRTVADVAGRNQGVYSAKLHREFDPTASEEYIQTHVRRLEAMRREGLVERSNGGDWSVAPDHLERAGQFEAAQRSRNPARITVLSWQSLDELPGAPGATWLDKQLIARSPEMFASRGLGSEIEIALRSRRQWLLEQGLAREQGGQIAYARNLLQTLERRELAEVSARMMRETGLDYAETRPGDRITGTYRRMLTLNSGRFALIERARDFSLVPWRPVLERVKGQNVVGVVGGEGISWSIGVRRGLGR